MKAVYITDLHEEIAKELMDFEEKNIERLKKYLSGLVNSKK